MFGSWRLSSTGSVVACLLLHLLPYAQPTRVYAQPDPGFILPMVGCPLAHCEVSMSDRAYLLPPLADVELVWHRNELAGEVAGISKGMGCSGNGTIVACTFRGDSDTLVVYDYAGNRLWSSGNLLSGLAYASPPVVSRSGHVIACDETRVVRIDPFGTGDPVVWNSEYPTPAIPIGPVLTQGNGLILATLGGPIYAYDVEDGSLIGELLVQTGPGDPGFFHTANTPAVRGNRVYVSMIHQVDGHPDEDFLSRLVAVDVDKDAADPRDRLKVAWHFTFGGPSGASPLVVEDVIFFDGDRPDPGAPEQPHIFAIRDLGGLPIEVWRQPAFSNIRVSFALDPRPGAGFWNYYPGQSPWLELRSLEDGAVQDGIQLDDLIGEPGNHSGSSAMTIAGGQSVPIMIVSASSFRTGSTYIAAIGLTSKALVWKYLVSIDPQQPLTAGQFPIILGRDGFRVVFATSRNGVRALGTAR